ncbi:PIN domain-containing protein [Candidatus Woesearchaeota archaeon]|nr:PIN domain-containing protein [Candidatus Woesearchaeota archaeon]
MKLCLDTYALVEIEKNTPTYRSIIEEEFIITAAALGEFYYLMARLKGARTAEYWAKRLLPFTEDVDKHLWVESMRFRAEHYKEKLSVIDALSYTYARKHKLLFVTGDAAFKDKPGVKHIA